MPSFVIRGGKLVDKKLAPPLRSRTNPLVLSDIQPFQTQDGVAITSRRALRDYERANGVRQVGNDYSGPERPAFWDQFLENKKRREH